MFVLFPDTPIQIYAPFGIINGSIANDAGDVDEYPWKRQVAKKETVLDKENVWDRVAVANKRDDVPEWAADHVRIGYTIIRYPSSKREGEFMYARVQASRLRYID